MGVVHELPDGSLVALLHPKLMADLDGGPTELPDCGVVWKRTGKLRWVRPHGSNDTDLVLQEEWYATEPTFKREWKDIPVVLSD